METIYLSEEEWNQLINELSAPAKINPQLQDLLNRSTLFKD